MWACLYLCAFHVLLPQCKVLQNGSLVVSFLPKPVTETYKPEVKDSRAETAALRLYGQTGPCTLQCVCGEKREEKEQSLSLVWKMNVGTVLKYTVSSCLVKSICF